MKTWYICNHMGRLIDNLYTFLSTEGFQCSLQMRHGMEVLCIILKNGLTKTILPIETSAKTTNDAEVRSRLIEDCIFFIKSMENEYPLIITEDRWNRDCLTMKKRVLTHLEIFSPIYARNCEIKRIDKSTAQEFLKKSHSYGHAACRYCYGLFLKRHTGKMSRSIPTGTLVAVATFSNARKWKKEAKIIRSYEWTRYASLPEIRLSGGMGKLLKAFIQEIQPDDIMSYADLEWSEGDVYKELGFTLEGQKAPVMFGIDNVSWERFPIRSAVCEETRTTHSRHPLYFQNFGSNKYRLKLTEHK